MSETAGIETPVGAEGTEPGTTETQTPEGQASETQSQGDNPNWSKFLEVLPTSLHETVKPVLKEWDQGVQQRFQEFHQQYDPYKPFVEQNVDANELTQAYALLQAINTDPRAIYDQMGQYFGYVGEGGQETPGSAPTAQQTAPTNAEGTSQFDFGSAEANAAWQQMQQQLEQQSQLLVTLGQSYLTEKQQSEAAQVDQVLDTQLNAAKTKHGEFDESYVLALVANGLDVDKAVEQYHTAIKTALEAKNRPSAPTILGGANGALPTNAVDPKTLNDKQTKDLVVEMLKSAAAT